MRILLINPSPDLQSLLGAGKYFVQKYEPLGLLYIAAILQANNHDVSVIDAYAEDLSLEQLKLKISRRDHDIIGISTLTCTGEIVFLLGKWIKKNLPKTTVVLGNIHASVYSKQYLQFKCCDLVVHGEGEEIFLKIVAWKQGKIKLENIPSISFADKNNQEIRTGGEANVQDLNQLSPPARDLLDQNLYNLTEISNQLYIGRKGMVAKTMVTSRGCPNRCTFCVVHGERSQRFIDPAKVVDEMEMLQKKYNASYITFMDPCFFGNTARVLAICSEIIKRGLKIHWGADAHINFMTKEIIESIAAAGCYELQFGIESGVQRLLNVIKKGTNIQQISKTIDLIKKHSKIKLGGLFILGLPEETYQDSLQTIRFAKRLPLDIAQFSILVPYPGSFLFEQLRKEKAIDTGIGEGGKLDTSVWRRYLSYISFTENEPIWVTPRLSADQLKYLQKRAQREFYLRPKQIFRHIRRIRPSNIVRIIKIISKGFF